MKWILMALALAGCARATGLGDGNSGDGRDLGAVGGNGATDDLGAPDLGGTSAAEDLAQPASSTDLGGAAIDLAQPAADLAQSPPDLAQSPPDLAQSSSDVTVHVLIDNFCNSSTNPMVIHAPLHVALNLTFVNDSHDYDADIWSSRGYGFLDLPRVPSGTTRSSTASIPTRIPSTSTSASRAVPSVAPVQTTAC